MTIRTTRPNLLIGDTCHPLGSVIDVSDDIGHRFIRARAAVPADLFDPPVPEVVESASAPEPPESADATPTRRRKTAQPSS